MLSIEYGYKAENNFFMYVFPKGCFGLLGVVQQEIGPQEGDFIFTPSRYLVVFEAQHLKDIAMLLDEVNYPKSHALSAVNISSESVTNRLARCDEYSRGLNKQLASPESSS